MVSDEPDDVFGDSINEEGQVVRQLDSTPASVPSTSGGLQTGFCLDFGKRLFLLVLSCRCLTLCMHFKE